MIELNGRPKIFVKQSFEVAELFGFETRNKYRILDESKNEIGFVAEQQKGIIGFFLRQFVGHWRSFEIHIYDRQRKPALKVAHPFRWYFTRLAVSDISHADASSGANPGTGRAIGTIEKRFSIFTKRFDVHDAAGSLIFEIASPIFKFWTFKFVSMSRERARVTKKWTGLGAELFTDKDTFVVEYLDQALTQDERSLVLAASLYVDLTYFEQKAGN